MNGYVVLFLLCIQMRSTQMCSGEHTAKESIYSHESINGIEVYENYAAFRLVPYTNLTAKLSFRKHEALPIMAYFDWVIYGHGNNFRFNNSQNVVPQTILCVSTLLVKRPEKTIAYFRDVPVLTNKSEIRSLVLAGADIRLSKVLPIVQNLLSSSKFSHIWYEAKDIDIPGVYTIPMGFRPYYFVEAGFQNVANAILRSAVPGVKKYLVCAAWGRFSPYLDDRLAARQSLVEFVNSSSWVYRSRWSPFMYWRELLKYKFSLSPEGNGVQSPKLFESMLVQTIPVSNRNPAAVDLQKMGFPIVIVDSWNEVTQEFLNKKYDEMEPLISWDKIRHMISIAGVMNLITLNTRPKEWLPAKKNRTAVDRISELQIMLIRKQLQSQQREIKF